MAPMDMKGHGDAQLETGLLRTHEENIPFTPTGLEQSRTGPTYCRPEAKESRKMPSPQRMVMIVMLSVLLGFGLALARDPSLSSSCIGWTCGDENVHMKAARSFLAKRNDASVTNVTTPGAPTESGTISSEQPTTPTASATPISSSHESTTTTTPSSAISVPSNSSPTSTPEASTPSPSITPPTSPTSSTSSTSSTIPNQTPPGTSTTSQGPESTPSGTSSTRHEAVSESSSSSVTPVSSSTPRETSTSSEPSLSTEASSSEAASTSSKIQKTITTGRVATTSPVPHVYTTTLPDGGTLTVTSTSWVAIVPTDKSSASTGPQLQNYAPKAQAHSMLVFAAEALAIGMLLI